MEALNKFIGIIIFQTESLDKNENISYEESIISVKANNVEQAKEIVNEYIQSYSTIYVNALGEQRKISLNKIVDITEQLREEKEENITELYSRHFVDLVSYLKFDNYTL